MAVVLLGIVGSLAVTGISAGVTGNRVNFVLEILNISNLSIQAQATILGTLAASLLILKTVASIYLTRKSLKFLGLRAAQISERLMRRTLMTELQQLKSNSLQTRLYSITSGVDVIVLGIVGTILVMAADFTLSVVMLIGLFALDKTLAISTLLFFGLVGFSLHIILSSRAQRISYLHTQYGIKSNQRILEILGAFREIFVKNRRDYYVKEIGEKRRQLAEIGAEKAFLPSISKYVFEITTVLGAFAIAAFQFYKTDALQAVSVLMIFLAASARISPAILRMQQGFITLRGSAASAGPTLEVIELELPYEERIAKDGPVDISVFDGTVEVKNVSFHYAKSKDFSLSKLSFNIQAGEIIGIVGRSGSGKSTLVDLLLGLLRPLEGDVFISGLSPISCIKKFPGKIGYVPQETSIFEGTIRENVALGYSKDDFTDEQIFAALKLAALKEFVDESKLGLETLVGERGTRISGGQRQRLGIARALLTNPQLLVLDEATSAMDGSTEYEISEAILNLKGLSTVIIIAHRLSTIKNVNKIIYLDKGKIQGVGSFAEIREKIPDFDNQAKLMGL
jgi:ABC-type multidrug transport system fused ATPase/permease subunit